MITGKVSLDLGDTTQILKLSNQETYFIGEKVECLSLQNLTGTNDTVGPGKYPVQNSQKTSVHTNFPTWTLGKSKRQGLYNKTWTKHETYEVYSNAGKQIRTKKKQNQKLKLGKQQEMERNSKECFLK